MHKSEINFAVELDENRVPENIFWDATENPNEGINQTKAISIGVWDQYHKGLLGINLWTKDMPANEMNHFMVDMVGNLSQMLKDSTNEAVLIEILDNAGRQMVKYLDEQSKKEKEG